MPQLARATRAILGARTARSQLSRRLVSSSSRINNRPQQGFPSGTRCVAGKLCSASALSGAGRRGNCTAYKPVSASMVLAKHAAPLVWIDCEMTGLDPDKEEIIEVFCLITNGDLQLLHDDGWGIVVHQPQSRMNQMDEWCIRTHGQSGLTAEVAASSVTPEQAADGLLEYIKTYVPEPRRALIAGNSVHFDKQFLSKDPYRKVLDHLHYRILDVSSIKEAAGRWAPGILSQVPQKKYLHKARDDILESIEEARFYKEAIFQAGERWQASQSSS